MEKKTIKPRSMLYLMEMDMLEKDKPGQEEMEATLEILSSGELMDQIKEAELALKEGKTEEFIPWDEVRRDV